MVEFDTPLPVDYRAARQPCVLVLDASLSMQNAIGLLNAWLLAFAQGFAETKQSQCEVAIVTSPPAARAVMEFRTIAEFQPPVLTADGRGSLKEAISCALRLLEDRKAFYRVNHLSYFRPLLFLVSDGHLSPDDDWQSLAAALRREQADNRLFVFAFGVPDADLEVLSKFLPVFTDSDSRLPRPGSWGEVGRSGGLAVKFPTQWCDDRSLSPGLGTRGSCPRRAFH